MLTPTEGKLMADLGAQAGLILRNVGLTDQLIAKLAELRASRLRIVQAQDSERRRIERDLHDGAQQDLLTIASSLELAASLAGRDEQRERELIAKLRAQTQQALETLRELAHGINPPLLTSGGLAAAVRSLAARSVPPAELTVTGLGRYPEAIETTVYFCCAEALQNAARHAPGSTVTLQLAETDGTLSFVATDDGPGFDAAAASSGLQNMSDRLAAVGGLLEIRTSPANGTTLTGRIGVTDEATASDRWPADHAERTAEPAGRIGLTAGAPVPAWIAAD